jgi:YidC/Oxa1 family membrane protein insertase
MDRSSIIGYVLILLIFIGYLFMTQQNVEEINKNKQAADSLMALNAKSDTIVRSESMYSVTPDTSIIVADTTPEVAERFYTIENDKLKLTISSKGGRPYSVWLKEFKRHDSTKLVLFDGEQSEFSYTLPLSEGVIQTRDIDFTAADTNVRVTGKEGKIIVESDIKGSTIIQSYSLEKGSNLVNYKLTLRNFQDKIARKNRDFQLNWNMAMVGQEKTVEDEKPVTELCYKYLAESSIEYLSVTEDEEERLQGNLHWISYKQKFFNATMIAPKGFSEDGIRISSESRVQTQANEIRHFRSNLYFPYERGKEESYHLQLYYGANNYSELKKLDIGLQKIIPLGWGIFGWVNKFIVIPVFNLLSSFISSYGIIILLLTIIIKLVLFPFMYKIYVSTAKMRLLKPELEELKVKVGGDMTKMQQEQMKLYKKAGVNPLGGCLPQLIQLPILIAMFRFFPASIELRQEAFLWAEDLSTYDSIFSWSQNIPLLSRFYGNHISLFTILMAVSTFIYSMRSTELSSMNKQLKIITYIMPIMLLFWFNSYSSGLSYYYFLANMITFSQNWVIKKFFVDEAKLHQQMKDHKAKKVTVTKSAFQRKLEEMAKKRGLNPKTGRK